MRCAFALSTILSISVAFVPAHGDESASEGPRGAEVLADFDQRGEAAFFIDLEAGAARPDETRLERRARIRRAKDAWLASPSSQGIEVRYDYAASASLFVVAHSRNDLAAVIGDASVRALYVDIPGRGHLEQSVERVGARPLQAEGWIGENRVIAVLDSGIYRAHPDLAGAVIVEKRFLDQGADVGPTAADNEGHGTHIAGILASRGVTTFPGLAPGALLVVVKVLDDEGGGWLSDWTAAVEFVTGLHESRGGPRIEVMNLSFGTNDQFRSVCDTEVPAFYAACRDAVEAGIVVVAASGNSGSLARMALPACYSPVIAVGASSDAASLRIASFTNRNERLSLLAPGLGITSCGIAGGPLTSSGTSQAAPHVAGAVALLAQHGDELDPDQIRDLLVSNGEAVLDDATGLTFSFLDVRRTFDALDLPRLEQYSCEFLPESDSAVLSWTPIDPNAIEGSTLEVWIELGQDSEVLKDVQVSSDAGRLLFAGLDRSIAYFARARVVARRIDGASEQTLTHGVLVRSDLRARATGILVRGDCNADGRIDISDAVRALGYLFLGTEAPACLESCDADVGDALDISDAVFIVGFLFLGGPAPEHPFPTCGVAPVADSSGCASATCAL
jgi:hypothetical protein